MGNRSVLLQYTNENIYKLLFNFEDKALTNRTERKNCFVLNFTANSYHWGCFGTSVELYDSLIERGYYVNYSSVNDTHRQMAALPNDLNNFDSENNAGEFATANSNLIDGLASADVVVCNGEGTLHHANLAPWSLLYLMNFTKKFLKKPVYLINQSSYPSGSLQASEQVDTLYRHVLENLDAIASREINSTAVLQRLGIKPNQSFDCLPRFINRHGIQRQVSGEGPILISGGASLNDIQCDYMAKSVAPFVSKNRPVIYLSGAKNNLAEEDKKDFELMRTQLPSLEFLETSSMTQWLEIIGNASALISGRFHHTIAAASLLTPVICIPSNTLKIEGICSMLGLEAPVYGKPESFVDSISQRLRRVFEGRTETISTEKWAEILSLANRNFDGL